MYKKPRFNSEELKEEFYDILEKYARDYNKKEIAALLAVEAEAAAHIYGSVCVFNYADYVRSKRKIAVDASRKIVEAFNNVDRSKLNVSDDESEEEK